MEVQQISIEQLIKSSQSRQEAGETRMWEWLKKMLSRQPVNCGLESVYQMTGGMC